MEHRTIATVAMIIAGVGATATVALPIAANASTAPEPRAVTHPAPLVVGHALECLVTANNVNYRSGPGAQYPALGQVSQGFQFTSDGAFVDHQDPDRLWENILRPGRPDGYIDTVYVQCSY